MIDNILDGKKIFVFDFDGTIINSEPLHWTAHKECLKDYGVTITSDDIKRYIGTTDKYIYSTIKNEFKLNYDVEKMILKKVEKFLELAEEKNIKPFKYFEEILGNYENVSFNILSSQHMEILEKFLEKWGIRKRFDTIISVSDTGIDKKEVYKNTFKYYKCNQEDVVLFEDSMKCLELAKKEGINTVGIEMEYNEGKLKNCDYIIVESSN